MDKLPTVYTSSTGFSIEVRTGLIINAQVDIILNTTAQNIDLTGSPLASCVRTDGITLTELDNIRHECERKAPEGLEMGEYVVSATGEDSGNRYIYHGCVMDGCGKISIQEYFNFIEECFDAAMCMGFYTLALPLVSMNRYSQPNAADEKTFAVSLLDRCIATFADKRDFCNMCLVLVDMKNNVLNRTYASVLISHNKQTNDFKSGASTKLTMSGSQPSSPTSHVQSQPNFQNWTKSLGPGISGGAIPKILHRTNSTGSSGDADLNKTHVFSGRHGRNGSAQSRPTSSSDNTSYDKSKNDRARRRASSSNASNTSHGGQNEQEIPVMPSRNGQKQSPSSTTGSSSANGKSLSCSVSVYSGNITDLKVDGIVHGTRHISTHMGIDLSGHIGKALQSAGGYSFEQQCKPGKADFYYPTKGVAVTKAGIMNYQHVIHADTSPCSLKDDWKKLIKNCLEESDKLGLTSLAFHALGTVWVKAEHQATNFKETLEEFSKSRRKSLREVHIVIYNNSTLLQIYKNILEDKTSNTVFPARDREAAQTGNHKPTTQKANHAKVDTSGILNFKYSGATVTVKGGDITNEAVECIVHGFVRPQGVYTIIPLHDAVGAAIRKKAGDTFQKTCDNTYIWSDQIEITSGYDLCKNIIHAGILSYSIKKEPTWNCFIRSCLGKAANSRIQSIAFPLIGSPCSDLKTLAQQQIAGLKQFLDINKGSVNDIRFVIYKDQQTLKLFKEAALVLTIQPPAQPQTKHHTSAAANLGPSNIKPAVGIINLITVEVLEGDITKDDSEMIVHGTTTSHRGISFFGKLGEAIAEAGGSSFRRECNAKWVSPKSCTVTIAGDMKSLYVLHIDVLHIQKDDTKAWKEAIGKALRESHFKKIKSVAFPPIGMGDAKLEQVTNMIIAFKEAIEEYDTKVYKHLKTIRFVIHSNPGLFHMFKEIVLPSTNTSSAIAGGHGPFQPSSRMNTQSHTRVLKGGINMEIVTGDLTKQTTDAIVHVTNSKFQFSGQSGEAIRRAGGKGFEDSCSRARFGIWNNVTFTYPGKMPCRKVLHLNASNLKQETPTRKIELIKTLVHDCLVAANKEALLSVSFPALGTGAHRCDPIEVAKSFKSAIEKFVDNTKRPLLTTIRIVIYDDQMFTQLAATLNSL